jgi:prolyl oligopeptidase
MKNLTSATIRIAAALILLTFPTAGFGQAVLPPPETEIRPVIDTVHGVTIEDPYRWLEDQESPETREWIDAQNEYTRSILDAIPGREELAASFAELIKTDRVLTPYQRENRFFLYKRAAHQEQYVICMREGLEGEDKVLVDPHKMSSDLNVSVGMKSISKDGSILAYSIRHGGADEETVELLDIDTMEKLPDSLPEAVYFSLSFKPDLSGYFYSRREERGSRVYYHRMGSDPSEDIEIFGEGYGPDKIVSCSVSPDGRYLVLSVSYGSSGKSEYYFQDLKVSDTIKTLVKDTDAIFYGRFAGDVFLLLTDWEAPNSRIFAVDLKSPAPEQWREIIPESDAVIKNFSAAGGKIFVNYLENVISRIKVYDLEGEELDEITFPSLGSVGSVSGRWESNDAFCSFSSFHIPSTIYRIDVEKGSLSVWDRLEVPINSEDFIVKQEWYRSKDGTRVPMFILHKKGMELDGSNPALLTGYGGFRAKSTPYFSVLAVAFAEYGGIYAVANIRGGAEFGEEWHEAAIFEKKQNTFDDFIAAAEHLIESGYTSPQKLAIIGGSNGGLLVGAVANQRPELFKAVVCTYPLLDMVRYHKFMMGQYWITEYGSADDPEQFEYIYKYSPYHNAKPGGRYPALLFVTGDSDTRVAPLHARKMTALMQKEKGSDAPVMLLYHTKAGHSGGQPVRRTIENLVDEMSFILWQLSVI